MNNQPLVSIITCFYNERPEYLRKCLESIFSETFPKIELILVNDASTNTQEINKVIPFDEPRLTYIQNSQNLGLTKSLNIALSKASGKYIARLDSNDFNLPGRISTQINFLEENTDYVLCGSKYDEIIEDRIIEPRTPFVETDTQIRKCFGLFNPFAHSTLMVKKSFIDQIGGYNEFYYYSQDYDLTYRMLKLGKGKNLNFPFVRRHIGPKDISRKNYKKQLAYTLPVRIKNLIFPHAFNIRNISSIIRILIILITPKVLIQFYQKVRFGYV